MHVAHVLVVLGCNLLNTMINVLTVYNKRNVWYVSTYVRVLIKLADRKFE